MLALLFVVVLPIVLILANHFHNTHNTTLKLWPIKPWMLNDPGSQRRTTITRHNCRCPFELVCMCMFGGGGGSVVARITYILVERPAEGWLWPRTTVSRERDAIKHWWWCSVESSRSWPRDDRTETRTHDRTTRSLLCFLTTSTTRA